MQNANRKRTPTGVDSLIDRLNAAVRLADVARITQQIKEDFIDLIARSAISLPDRLKEPLRDSYARRLLHCDHDRQYSVVAMIWGPTQHTGLHDHAGMWCVESVLEGELDVTQFDLVERREDRYRFLRKSTVRAGVGHAGSLIPPYEYHVLSNPLSDRTSITLHVYGGEMNHCNVYLPEGEGWWRKTARRLGYDEA